MTDECQAPGLECEQCRLKCQLPLIEAEKARLEKSDADKERYAAELYSRARNAEQKVKELEGILGRGIDKLLTHITNLEVELARLQVALDATIAEKEKYKRALKTACEINSDMFATPEEAMNYCIGQAKEASK